MEVFSFIEYAREENRKKKKTKQHFVALSYSVSPNFHYSVAVPPFVQSILFTDDNS